MYLYAFEESQGGMSINSAIRAPIASLDFHVLSLPTLFPRLSGHIWTQRPSGESRIGFSARVRCVTQTVRSLPFLTMSERSLVGPGQDYLPKR